MTRTLDKPLRHPWDVSPSEGIEIQQRLRGEVVCQDRLRRVRHVAGIDVGFPRHRGTTRAAVAVLRYPGLEMVDHSLVEIPTRFPYVPGLLSFREVPAVLEALKRLQIAPDLMLCDGQGISPTRGAWAALQDKEEIIGAVLRTRAGVKPLYISPGHRIGLESAVAWVMACTTRFRLPETTRQAHHLASVSKVSAYTPPSTER